MTSIVPFKAQKDLKASQQLDDFIAWAKVTLLKGVPKMVWAGVRWEDDTWHQWGIRNCTFYVLGSKCKVPEADRVSMRRSFIDFAKAVIVYRRVYQGFKTIDQWLRALKALEAALVELAPEDSVTNINASICNKACEYMQKQWPTNNNAYAYGRALMQIIDLMRSQQLLSRPFRWTSPIALKRRSTLKQQREDSQKKLPSRESIVALGEIFNNDLTSPLDIITVSACAILLGQPSRIGELSDLPLDCLVYKDGSQRMNLRWYCEKGVGPVLKPVMHGMESSIERALSLVKPLTDEAREYAAWLEDHPDEFPPHAGLPNKALDESLSYDEACAALRITVHEKQKPRARFKSDCLDNFAKRAALSPEVSAILNEIRSGWDAKGKRVYTPGTTSYEMKYADTCVITLRMLNLLMREKYLPKDFPYTTPFQEGKPRLKYRDALFTVRTGTLPDETRNAPAMARPFGVELAASLSRVGLQLAGTAGGKTQSIFERHGYPGVRVNTHAFRHELNTEMQRAGLSQLLIDAFSGRTSMGSVYNHETVEERTQALIAVHPSTKQVSNAERLEKVKTNAPLNLSDVTKLDENAQDRIIHKTHLGICVHDFSYAPCPKMGACLTCGRLGCVKGDEVKLANLKEERNALQVNYHKAVDAEAREVFGACEWRKKAAFHLFKCNALIETLENPELDNGDIVWNQDNGWNLTNNAAVMACLVDPKEIEAQAEEAMPSLADLESLMGQLED